MLEKIKLTHFRNFSEQTFDFSEQTAICGANGSGKTNLLEAIGLCSLLKSFRGATDNEMVQEESDYYRVEANLPDDLLEVIFQNNFGGKKKTAKFNQVKFNLSEFIGRLKMTYYAFESNALVMDGPIERRKFLDAILCQIYPSYTQAVLRLVKVIKNRNRLLFEIKNRLAKPDELTFWDLSLISLAKEITEYRTELVNFLSERISSFYQEISTNKNDFKIIYQTNSIFDLNKLEENRFKEIEQGRSLYGPHRDDLLFLYSEKPIANFLSRGEIKSFIFALKKSEAEFISLKSKVKPIILLDDILAELDLARKEKLADFLSGYRFILTTTNSQEVKELFPKIKIIELKNG